MTLLTAAAEWGSVAGYLAERLSLAACFLVHLAAVALLTIWLLLLRRAGGDIKLSALVLVLTAVIGPFGSFISVLMLTFYFLYSKSQLSFLQWVSALLPSEKESTGVELYQRISSGWDDFSDKRRNMSFQDAITLGTIQQKREALAKISRYYRREFAPALMSAIHDSSNAIRVQAATVIAKFEQEYISHYMNLSRQHQAEPENAPILLKLAQQADAYAYSGILDAERERSFRNIAIEKYTAYLEMEPGDTQIFFALGRLYLHVGNPDQAYQTLSRFLDNDRKLPLNLVMWLVESLYYLKKYTEIRRLIAIYEEDLGPESDYALIIKETLQLWKNGISEEKLVIQYADEA
ncbi:MAG: hypothetical protein ABIK68_05870 [bacterium]